MSRRNSTLQQIMYLSIASPDGGVAGGGIVAGTENAFYKMKFYPDTSFLEMESLSGGNSSISVSSVNGHTVELDVNSTPVSPLQALDDWDAIYTV